MNVLLSHFDLTPLLYGLIMAVGLGVMLYKFLARKWLSFSVDVFVFWLVFALHGGTQKGGFAAMICALIAGMTFPTIIRKMTA